MLNDTHTDQFRIYKSNVYFTFIQTNLCRKPVHVTGYLRLWETERRMRNNESHWLSKADPNEINLKIPLLVSMGNHG